MQVARTQNYYIKVVCIKQKGQKFVFEKKKNELRYYIYHYYYYYLLSRQTHHHDSSVKVSIE